ncbi:MAG: FHA domain-containing protein, partial [Desulfuromonadales bacterium]|nr:FHA domain-containing protein [Desulfuromonadales bacterium]
RFHAEIYRQNYPFYIEDKKSTNGVCLNGAVINFKRALSHNDKIMIGKHTLVFVEEPKDGFGGKQQPDINETLCLSPDDLARLREQN